MSIQAIQRAGKIIASDISQKYRAGSYYGSGGTLQQLGPIATETIKQKVKKGQSPLKGIASGRSAAAIDRAYRPTATGFVLDYTGTPDYWKRYYMPSKAPGFTSLSTEHLRLLAASGMDRYKDLNLQIQVVSVDTKVDIHYAAAGIAGALSVSGGTLSRVARMMKPADISIGLKKAVTNVGKQYTGKNIQDTIIDQGSYLYGLHTALYNRFKSAGDLRKATTAFEYIRDTLAAYKRKREQDIAFSSEMKLRIREKKLLKNFGIVSYNRTLEFPSSRGLPPGYIPAWAQQRSVLDTILEQVQMDDFRKMIESEGKIKVSRSPYVGGQTIGSKRQSNKSTQLLLKQTVVPKLSQIIPTKPKTAIGRILRQNIGPGSRPSKKRGD